MTTQSITIFVKTIHKDEKERSTTYTLTRDAHPNLTANVKLIVKYENGSDVQEFHGVENIGRKLLTETDISPNDPSFDTALGGFQHGIISGLLFTHLSDEDEFALTIAQEDSKFYWVEPR